MRMIQRTGGRRVVLWGVEATAHRTSVELNLWGAAVESGDN